MKIETKKKKGKEKLIKSPSLDKYRKLKGNKREREKRGYWGHARDREKERKDTKKEENLSIRSEKNEEKEKKSKRRKIKRKRSCDYRRKMRKK